jgi:iron(III) transport system substrate-binding protein
MSESSSRAQVSRAIRPRWMSTAVATIATIGLLAGCSSSSEPTAPENEISEGEVPDYYPAEYAAIIEAAEAEGGELTIYSNTDQENWAPIFRDFQKKYPFVETINANNLDSDEVFQRQLSESATGNAPADVLVSNAAQAWAEYAATEDPLLEYTSPELGELPDFTTLLPNVYTLSVDPMTIAYNTAVMPEAPTGIGNLAEIIAADPELYAGKITTRDVNGAFGFTVSHAFTEAKPDAWADLEEILPNALPETSSGTQGEKILAGEYLAGFFISAAPAYPIVESSGGIFEVVFPEDGTVVLPRGMGITPEAPNVNTAKLFVDFVMSEEGQNAVAEGGLTSYRDSVEAADGLHTYQEVVDTVGEDNVIFAGYDLVPEDEVTDFIEQWDGLLGR